MLNKMRRDEMRLLSFMRYETGNLECLVRRDEITVLCGTREERSRVLIEMRRDARRLNGNRRHKE